MPESVHIPLENMAALPVTNASVQLSPVAVSFTAFEDYYEREAETWELLALTRARVVWASSPDFAQAAAGAVETALRRPRDRARS